MVTKLRKLFEALAARRTRNELHLLSDRMLKDIGLSRHDIDYRIRG
jgi:uncharacterized protein YjiS (DUF1127 family)